jgi:hypothetical protein
LSKKKIMKPDKLIRCIALLSALGIFFHSCKKEQSEPASSNNAPPPKQGMYAKIDSSGWEAVSPKAVMEDKSIVITGKSAQSTEIILNINGITPQTYPLGIGKVSSVYLNSYTTTYGEGSIVITKTDTIARKISGTFTAKIPSNTTSGLLRITEGTFNDIPYTKTPSLLSNNFVAKINGISYQPNIEVNESLNEISIKTTSVNKMVVISFLPTIRPGTFDLTDPGSTTDASYSDADGIYYTNSGTLTITSHNPMIKRISGSFSFTAGQGGKIKTITEGKFAIRY